MSKPLDIKKEHALSEYLVKLGNYVIVGPGGIIPLTYVVQIDLVKDRAVLERIKKDPQFSERFTLSTLTPVKVEDAEKMKTGTVAITLKANM
jgi:hypothetical protein